jgi:hypothetical protein
VEFAIGVNRILRQRRWLLVATAAAILVALNIAFHVSLFPPRLEPSSAERGAASSQLLVDTGESSLPNLAVPIESLGGRAQVYAELLRTETVRRRIADEAGIPWTSLFVDGTTTDAPDGEPQPSAEEREVQLANDDKDARLFFRVDPSQPIIRVITQGKTVDEAVTLADAAAMELSLYADELQASDGVPEERRVEITQLGRADGGEQNASTTTIGALLAGIATFAIGCLLILFVPRMSQALRRARAAEGEDAPSPPMQPPAPRGRAGAAAQPVAAILKHGRAGLPTPEPKPAAKPEPKPAAKPKPKPAAKAKRKPAARAKPKPAEAAADTNSGGNGPVWLPWVASADVPPDQLITGRDGGASANSTADGGNTGREASGRNAARRSSAGGNSTGRKPARRKAAKRKPAARKPAARKRQERKPAEPKPGEANPPAEPNPAEAPTAAEPKPPEPKLPEPTATAEETAGQETSEQVHAGAGGPPDGR